MKMHKMLYIPNTRIHFNKCQLTESMQKYLKDEKDIHPDLEYMDNNPETLFFQKIKFNISGTIVNPLNHFLDELANINTN